MPHMMNDAAFRAYAIACSILVLKMSVAGLMTAATRSRVKQFLNPEDARVLGGAGVMQEHPDVMRMLRMHRNDLENILPFFTVGLIFVLMGASAFRRPGLFLHFHRRADRSYDYLRRENAAVENGGVRGRYAVHGRDGGADSDRRALTGRRKIARFSSSFRSASGPPP